MALSKNTTAVQRFLVACFDSTSDWRILNVAVSGHGWSLVISHNREEWEWHVQGDEATIWFHAEKELCSFSIHAGNPPTALCAAIVAVQPLMRLQRWGWVQLFEDEEA